jgi:hypothetical protein
VPIDPVQHGRYFTALAEAVHPHIGDRSDGIFHAAFITDKDVL